MLNRGLFVKVLLANTLSNGYRSDVLNPRSCCGPRMSNHHVSRPYIDPLQRSYYWDPRKFFDSVPTFYCHFYLFIPSPWQGFSPHPWEKKSLSLIKEIKVWTKGAAPQRWRCSLCSNTWQKRPVSTSVSRRLALWSAIWPLYQACMTQQRANVWGPNELPVRSNFFVL